MSAAVITLLIILCSMIFFVFEIVPVAITALLVILSLITFKILGPNDAFSGFSNNTTLLILFMSAIGEALFKTGIGQKVAKQVLKVAGKNDSVLIFAITGLATVLSSVSSNTGATLVLLPLVISTAKMYGKKPSHFLIPLSFGTAFGGILTLIGRAPNMIISGFAKDQGLAGFGFFELGKIGLPIAIICIIYMVFIGKKQLEDRPFQTEEVKGQFVVREEKQWIAVAILIGVIIAMVGINPISQLVGFNLTTVAMLGAILTVVTGCIDINEFFKSVSWTSIFLFAGLMPLGKAMQETGAARMIADFLITIMPSHNSLGIVVVLFLVGGLLAQFMSHTAASTILAPVFYMIAVTLNIDPHALLILLAISTGMAMATPIGTPPNIIVYGVGGYKFVDFVKLGVPMLLIGLVVSVILIPIFYPL